MSKQLRQSRRMLLRGLGLGVTLPSVWSAPLVKRMVLPSHATMSVSSFSVEKTQSGGPNPVTAVGDVIEYTVVVSNTGDIPLTNVVATDFLPDGEMVTLSGATESLASDGVLEVGESWSYAISYSVTLADLVNEVELTNAVEVQVDEVTMTETDTAVTLVEPIVCPSIVVDDVLLTTPSPQDVNNPVCGMSFNIYSGDAVLPIEVLSIETTTLADNVTISFDAGLGEATISDGIRVNWTGPASGAPFCNAMSEPFDDVTFTITAECELAPGFPYTQEVTLLELYALAELST